MRKFLKDVKKKIRSIGRRGETQTMRTMSVEEATRLTVQRYGDVLRNLADK